MDDKKGTHMDPRHLRLIAMSFVALMSTQVKAVEFITEAERRAQYIAIEERANKKHDQHAQVARPSPRNKSQPSNSIHKITSESNIYDYAPGTIVIKTGEKTLHYIEDDGTMMSFPIAVGRDGAQWFGNTKVTHKRKNPEWRPTPNMRKRNPRLPTVVGPGPSNPMGIRAIYLSEGYLRIHGTNEPASIGKAVSSGCYRMLNEHVSVLYEKVASGAQVVVLK